jgi:hypothetical protein
LLSVFCGEVPFCNWHFFLVNFHGLISILGLFQEILKDTILLSLVERPRQYHEQEEAPEMMAARIDRDVVSRVGVIKFCFFKRKKFTETKTI